ncbi:hypothetical protein B0H14DRAFT_2613010 [Mycena olivaceomarginata]|nr:hypothetical protein B0H14DRAFT_2613010 [Mycena olivaceomarginata]
MEHIHGDTAAQTAWTNLKEVLKAMRDGSDLCRLASPTDGPQPDPLARSPDHCRHLKATLVGVTAIMDSIDRVGDVNDEFVRITNNVKGFQVIAALFAAASPNLVSRELKLVGEAIGTKTERGRARRALEAPGDVDKVVIAFKRFGNVIDRFQVGSPSFWSASGLLTSSVARYGPAHV